MFNLFSISQNSWCITGQDSTQIPQRTQKPHYLTFLHLHNPHQTDTKWQMSAAESVRNTEVLRRICPVQNTAVKWIPAPLCSKPDKCFLYLHFLSVIWWCWCCCGDVIGCLATAIPGIQAAWASAGTFWIIWGSWTCQVHQLHFLKHSGIKQTVATLDSINLKDLWFKMNSNICTFTLY